MFTERQRKRIEGMLAWAEKSAAECTAANRLGPANHHRARASALRAILWEVDRLTRLLAEALANAK